MDLIVEMCEDSLNPSNESAFARIESMYALALFKFIPSKNKRSFARYIQIEWRANRVQLNHTHAHFQEVSPELFFCSLPGTYKFIEVEDVERLLKGHPDVTLTCPKSQKSICIIPGKNQLLIRKSSFRTKRTRKSLKKKTSSLKSG